MPGNEARLQELLDREDIRQCLFRYSRAIDRVDEALLRTVYWPGAVDNHGSFNGDAEGFIAWVIPLLQTMDQTMHLLGNMLIEVDGDRSASETYFVAFHRRTGDDGKPVEAHVVGRYLDQMERRGGEWRILHRDCVYDFNFEGQAADWTKRAFDLDYRTNRKPDDISYRILPTRG